MVKQCCICKIEYGVLDDVTFHKIPSNEELKQKWFAIIGREVGKHSVVCSQHFNDEGFVYKIIGNNIHRFLKSTAVPSLSKFSSKSDSLSEENSNVFNQECVRTPRIPIVQSWKETNSKYVISVTDVDESDCISHVKSEILDIENVQHNAQSEKIIEDKNIKRPLNELQDGKKRNHRVSFNEETDSKYVNNMSDVDESDCVSQVKTEILDIENVQHNAQSEKMTEDKNLKRPLNEAHDDRKRNHRLRYVGDLQRKDFTSDFSWHIVKSYREETKQKHKILNQKVRRLSKKIEYLESLLNPLHKKDNKKRQNNTTSSKCNKNSVSSKSEISFNCIVDHDYI